MYDVHGRQKPHAAARSGGHYKIDNQSVLASRGRETF